MDKQKSAFYNGITFVDIDRQINLPTDYETDRIPNKGDVMCFNSIIGNESTYYHCVVLYVYDQRTILSTSIEEGEIFQTSIYVVTKKIEPELGSKVEVISMVSSRSEYNDDLTRKKISEMVNNTWMLSTDIEWIDETSKMRNDKIDQILNG